MLSTFGTAGRYLVLTALESIERTAALVPLPRKHRHRYYGVLASNSQLRSAVTAMAQAPFVRRNLSVVRASFWLSAVLTASPAPVSLPLAGPVGHAGIVMRGFDVSPKLGDTGIDEGDRQEQSEEFLGPTWLQ